MLKKGDILICKKDFCYNDCGVTKGKKYKVCRVFTSSDGYSISNIQGDNNVKIDFVIDDEYVYSQSGDYHRGAITNLWNHFETKTDRAKRIIKEWKQVIY